MIELLHALLRILFPLDAVARMRGMTEDYILWLIRPTQDPRAIAHLHASPAARRELLSHIAVIEQGIILLAHHRARQLLNLPFQYRDATRRFPVRDKSVEAILARLTRLAALFDNLETLAQRRAERMQRERNGDSLRLAASLQSTSPSLRLVEAYHRRLASTCAQHWGRWIGASSRRDGRGCASSRGSPSAQMRF